MGNAEPSQPDRATISGHYSRRNLADIEVEAPNMEGVVKRAAQLHKLREVGLGGWKRESDPKGHIKEPESYAEVARAFGLGEREGDILSTCPSIQGLDLSRSLLPSWLEVSRITAELPRLQSLLLHFNRFEQLSPTSMPIPNAFDNLGDLRIDGTRIGWGDILSLAPHLSALDTLQMGSNGITRLDGALTTARLGNLKLLNLEGNELNDWEDVWASLKACPRLERLVLSSNDIGRISTIARQDEHCQPRHISIWDNPISSWSDVDALDTCVGGNLKSLVMGGDRCPLTRNVKMEDVRPIAIARLAELLTFNNATIRPVERRDAELFYLSVVVKENAEDVAERHPRYTALTHLHGAPQRDRLDKDGASETLRSKLLSVNIYLSSQPPRSTPPYVKAAPASYTKQSAQLNLLTTTPLRLLMGKMARSLLLPRGARSVQSTWALLSATIDPSQITAELLRRELRPGETSSDERITYEMDSLERDLAGYNFSIGDEIVLVVGEP